MDRHWHLPVARRAGTLTEPLLAVARSILSGAEAFGGEEATGRRRAAGIAMGFASGRCSRSRSRAGRACPSPAVVPRRSSPPRPRGRSRSHPRRSSCGRRGACPRVSTGPPAPRRDHLVGRRRERQRVARPLLVRAGRGSTTPPKGFASPLEVAAVEPRTSARFLPPADASVALALGDGQGIRVESSARLRGLGPGA